MSYCTGQHGFFWAGRGQRDRTSTRGALHPQLLSHSWWCMKYECNQWEVQRVDNSMMCRSLRKLTMWMSRLLRLDFGLPRFSTEAVVILMHVVAAPCAGSSRRWWCECAGADLSSWAICHVDFSDIYNKHGFTMKLFVQIKWVVTYIYLNVCTYLYIYIYIHTYFYVCII